MMRIKNISILSMMLLLLLSLLIACSNDSQTSKEGAADGTSNPKGTDEEDVATIDFSNDDVTIKVATPWGEEHFMERIGNYAQEKNPHMTVEHIDWNGSAEQLQELYGQGITPDVF